MYNTNSVWYHCKYITIASSNNDATKQVQRTRYNPPKQLIGGNLTTKSRILQPNKTYTVAISTTSRRGSALTEPTAAVLLCLLSSDGDAILHRIPPIIDSYSQQIDATPAYLTKKRRFQEGSVDVITFTSPDIGTVSSILVGPESGSWGCDEINIVTTQGALNTSMISIENNTHDASDQTRATRFVCRDILGDGHAQGAAYLYPVPADSVLYGSEENMKILSKEEARQLYIKNMHQYEDLKVQLLSTTGILVILGSAILLGAGQKDLSVSFGCGGVFSLMYQRLLQQRVDGIGGGDAVINNNAEGDGNTMSMYTIALGVSIAFLGWLAVQNVDVPGLGVVGASTSGGSGFKMVGAACTGFLMGKVALLITTFKQDAS